MLQFLSVRSIAFLSLVTLLAGADANVATAQQARTPNDVARFLAGLPGREGGPFKALEETADWKAHAASFDAAWSRLVSDRLPKMAAFYTRELRGEPVDGATVFYPFGGPDALAVMTLFPIHRNYVLVGLEPSGSMVNVDRILKHDLGNELATLRSTLDSVMIRSFFITKQMDSSYRGQITDGLLPAIMVLLARMNQTITNVRWVMIEDDGSLRDRKPEEKITGRTGIEITFTTGADPEPRKLRYFSLNLADEKLGGNRGFQAYARSLGKTVSYFKATSYMTHRPEFSVIRDLTLEISSAVLQDDSGIPYKYFDPAKWSVQLYGDYTQPYGSFRYLIQKDLRAAYVAPGASKPLDFKIGYGYSKAPSNLLFAKKKQ